MVSPQRKIFKTTQDWHKYIESKGGKIGGKDLYELRKVCYSNIEESRKRPLLVYASKFLENLPQSAPNFIDLSDIDGFTDLVNSVDSSNIDILLHSPGGRPDATERIVSILRNKFKDISFLVPHSVYSAATMLAVSGDRIIVHPSATLGPIDPQINGIPARSVKRGFENIKEKITKEGPESLPAYIPLIEKYSIELLELCDDSEKLAKNLVTSWLEKYMFKGSKGEFKKVKAIVNYLSDHDTHLIHSRPLSIEHLVKLGLRVEPADPELKLLMWEANILLNGFFSIGPFVKLYENARGISWGKQFQQVVVPVRPPGNVKPV